MVQVRLLEIRGENESTHHVHPILRSYENFRSELTWLEGKNFLLGQPVGTHLVLLTDVPGKFLVVFVDHTGRIKQDFIKIINPETGLFRNGGMFHVGPLVKVIRDVMTD